MSPEETASPIELYVPSAESPGTATDPYEPEEWRPLNMTDDISFNTVQSETVVWESPEIKRNASEAALRKKRREEVEEKVRKMMEAKYNAPKMLEYCGETPPLSDFQYNKHLRDYIYVPEWMEGRSQSFDAPWDFDSIDSMDFSM